MNRPEDTTFGRRALLRNGGLAVTLGGMLAACGADRRGPQNAGRLGVAPPPPTLPPVEVDDLVHLRTMQSLEHTLVGLHADLVATGGFSDAELVLVARLTEDHLRHAETVGSMIEAMGGEQFACANPFMVDRLVNPTLAALEGTDDLHRDVLNIAHGFEAIAGASYQAFANAVSPGAARGGLALLGGEECRHAEVLARVINPDQSFAPSFFGEPDEKDAAGFPVPYAIPSVFGTVNGIELVVGARNVEGTRVSLQLQTPAQNSYVYDYQSC